LQNVVRKVKEIYIDCEYTMGKGDALKCVEHRGTRNALIYQIGHAIQQGVRNVL
jgi:hypothetical protein